MEFTKTELRRRIRAGKALLGPGYRHMKTEIGLRVRRDDQIVVGRVPRYEDIWMEHDDLDEFVAINDHTDLRQGQILHLYLSENLSPGDRYGAWELYDTRVIWVGDADHEPMLLDNVRPACVACGQGLVRRLGTWRCDNPDHA